MKTLWRLYLFVLCSATLIMIGAGFFAWETVKHEAKSEIHYLNTVSFNATHALLDYQQGLLAMAGDDLITYDLDDPAGKTAAQHLLERLIASNPDIGLVTVRNTKGDFLLVSDGVADSIDWSKLSDNELVQKNLLEALNSDGLVIGNNLYINPLNQQFIGVHYAVRDENRRPVFVLTAGLKYSVGRSSWNNSTLTDGTILQIFKDDYYYIYSSRPEFQSDPEVYLEPIPESLIEAFLGKMYQQNGITKDSLMSSGQLVLVDNISVPGLDGIFAIQYQPDYGYFTLASIEKGYLYRQFMPSFLFLCAVFFLFNFILFALFRYSSKEQNKWRSNLEYQAVHDPLTGLNNRTFLDQNFELWNTQNGGEFCILFIDLDNFKVINDNYGHSIGDHILSVIAERINAQFSGMNIRLGGDEFIIFLDEKDKSAALRTANEFIIKLMRPIEAGDSRFSITSSIGIVKAPENGNDLDVLLSKADIAMYKAKRHRNQACLFSAEMEAVSERSRVLEKALRFAVERDELYLVYQPQINAISKRITGIEALVRWRNPGLGNVPPSDFIPLAETSGLMVDVGRFIITRALREVSEIVDRFGKLRLSINVSVQQLLADGFFEFFKEQVRIYDREKLSITLEVTESLFIEDLKVATGVLERFRRIGVAVSLDDFGTGYSSLSLLSNLPIDELKIDKAFIDAMMEENTARQLVSTIVKVGKDLNLVTVAEGVEEHQQEALLVKFGCDFIQGYYYSKPLNAADLCDYLGQCCSAA